MNKVQKTRKQHFVWRYYLKSWTKESKIYTYFKDSKKIIRTSLLNIGQQRDFYKLHELTKEEIHYSKELLKALSIDYKEVIVFIDTTQELYNMKELVDNLGIKEFEFHDKFTSLTINSGENIKVKHDIDKIPAYQAPLFAIINKRKLNNPTKIITNIDNPSTNVGKLVKSFTSNAEDVMGINNGNAHT